MNFHNIKGKYKILYLKFKKERRKGRKQAEIKEKTKDKAIDHI